MSAYDDEYSGEEQPEDFAEDSDILRIEIETIMWEMVMDGEADVGIDKDGEPVYSLQDDGRDDNL